MQTGCHGRCQFRGNEKRHAGVSWSESAKGVTAVETEKNKLSTGNIAEYLEYISSVWRCVLFDIRSHTHGKPLTESNDIPVFPVIVAIVTVLQWLILRQPLKNMYQQAVQDNEYDEFGVSKKKSYQNLTRKEREQMDLQKMADMERLLSSSVLNRRVRQGNHCHAYQGNGR